MQPTASARSHGADYHDRATPLQSALRRSIDIYRLLRTVPSLADLAIQPLAALVDCLEVQAISTGQPIVRSGERSERLYLIVRGQVRIAYPGDTSGERGATIIGASALFGGLALDTAPRSLSATAVCPTLALLLSRAAYCQLLREQPAITEALAAELVARRIREVGRSPEHVY
jgi:CRP-like cAMP-binding protein